LNKKWNVIERRELVKNKLIANSLLKTAAFRIHQECDRGSLKY